MIELRYFVKESHYEYHDDGLPRLVQCDAVLQYRKMQNIEEAGLHPPIWGEWEDVPTVHE